MDKKSRDIRSFFGFSPRNKTKILIGSARMYCWLLLIDLVHLYFPYITQSQTDHDRRVDHPSCQFKPDRSWLNLYDQHDRQIKKPDQIEKEIRPPHSHIDENILDRIQGSLIGLALGDALGAHVEFRPHQYLVENPVTDLEGGGTWGLKKGQFTDDTSMALCLAISLIARQGFEPYDQLVRYKWWYKHGYMSSTGECFDIGAATSDSLKQFIRRQHAFAKKHKVPLEQLDFLSDHQLLQKFNVKCSTDGVAGNGALMRLAPAPLFFRRFPTKAVEYSGYSGLITHGDQQAYDACRYYGALIVAALDNCKKEELLDKNFYKNHESWFDNKPLCDEIRTIAEGSYQKEHGYDDGIRGKGYIVNALEAALWAFWSDDNSFEKGVLAAVNLGDDADTTAAIYGQLAGAYYGYKNLPKQWVGQIYANSFIINLSKWIAYEGENWEPSEQTVLVYPPSNGMDRSNSAENILEAEVPIEPSEVPSHVSHRKASHGALSFFRNLFVRENKAFARHPDAPSSPATPTHPRKNHEASITKDEVNSSYVRSSNQDVHPSSNKSNVYSSTGNCSSYH